MTGLFGKYLLPGLVFQSVIIGGGYGTGRELVEFFLSHGPLGGLLGMGVATIVWCIVLALGFEFARLTAQYEYRGYFQALIGPLWRLFEVTYLLMALVVLAVLGSASGELTASAFGVPSVIGTSVLLIAIGIIAFYGSFLLERVLAFWSIVLYVAYGALVIAVMRISGDTILAQLASKEVIGAWHLDGARYAGYSLAVLAPVLFALRHLETRGEALSAGVIAGVIGIVPAVFVFIAMLARYPDIVDAPVPVMVLLDSLGAGWFIVVFQIVLFGTFIETGAGIIHAVNQRIARVLERRGRVLSHWARFAIAVSFLGAAIFLAEVVGIIDLIAKGYGTLSYLLIAIVVVPLLTFGAFRIFTTQEFGYAK